MSCDSSGTARRVRTKKKDVKPGKQRTVCRAHLNLLLPFAYSCFVSPGDPRVTDLGVTVM